MPYLPPVFTDIAAGSHGEIDANPQPAQRQNDNQGYNPSHVGHNLLVDRIGGVEGVLLDGIVGVHSKPDVGSVRIGIAVYADILVQFLLAENRISHKDEAVRIINQVTPVFIEGLRYLIVRQIRQAGHIGIGAHPLIRHHPHHILHIAVPLFVSLVADLIALIIQREALDGRHHIFLQLHVVHPVPRIACQLLVAVHCGIAAVQHGDIYGQAAVVLSG